MGWVSDARFHRSCVGALQGYGFGDKQSLYYTIVVVETLIFFLCFVFLLASNRLKHLV